MNIPNKVNYVESLNHLLEINHNDHEYTSIESNLINAIEDCTQNLSEKPINQAMRIATDKFETAINNAWKLLYLIPMIAIEDSPEKWMIIEDSPLLGKDFQIGKNAKVHVDMIELHADTIDGSPSAVYRINANSKLAFMLYGNTVIEYTTKNGDDMEISRNYSCATFIKQFPFVVPYPTVTTIIRAKDEETGTETSYGYISDIRNLSREEVSEDELRNHFFSPSGTSIYPNLTQEEIDLIKNPDEEVK